MVKIVFQNITGTPRVAIIKDNFVGIIQGLEHHEICFLCLLSRNLRNTSLFQKGTALNITPKYDVHDYLYPTDESRMFRPSIFKLLARQCNDTQ